MIILVSYQLDDFFFFFFFWSFLFKSMMQFSFINFPCNARRETKTKPLFYFCQLTTKVMTTSWSKSLREIFKYFELCMIGWCVFYAKLERSLFLAFFVTFNIKAFKSPKFFIGHIVGKNTTHLSLCSTRIYLLIFSEYLWRTSNSGKTIFEYFFLIFFSTKYQ